MFIVDFIDFDHGCWKEALVRKCFMGRHVGHILNIRYVPCGLRINSFWHHASNGDFSVRSACFLMQLKRQRESRESSGVRMVSSGSNFGAWMYRHVSSCLDGEFVLMVCLRNQTSFIAPSASCLSRR